MILDVGLDGEPVTFQQGAALHADIEARRVGFTAGTNQRGDYWSVSTVHTVINYRMRGGGPPVCWETLVEFLPADGSRGWTVEERYDSRHMAALGHASAEPLVFEYIRVEEFFASRWHTRMRAHGGRFGARMNATVRSLAGIETPFIYGLDGKPTDPMTGAALFEDAARRALAVTVLEIAGRSHQVKTMFHVYDDDAATCEPDPIGPRLWGTAIIADGSYPREVAKYRSAEEAEAGHKAVVDRLENADLSSFL